MGLPLRRTLARIFRVAFIGVVLAYALQEYMHRRQYYFKSHNYILLNDPTESEQDIVHEQNENATIWRLMVKDPTISQYVKLNEQFDDIRGHLDNASEIYTLYVPIDSAFENQTYPADAPDFYWKFLSLNHMGPGAVSHEDLIASTTVKNFINHDIYFKYLQRLSVKDKDGDLIFNHVGKYVGKEIKAVNGYIHHISALLHLPDATSDILRDNQRFSTFRKGLIFTDVAARVNDSQSHLTQTIFAPSNKAFAQLGPGVNKFLFSPWGKPYLTALLKHHIIENSTMFSDVYFQPNGMGEIKLNVSSKTIQLPTLNAGVNLTISIVTKGHRQSIMIDRNVIVSNPDMIAMDGVIHGIDNVLFPLSHMERKDVDGGDHSQADSHSKGPWYRFWWPWNTKPTEISVEELMERLEPIMQQVEST